MRKPYLEIRADNFTKVVIETEEPFLVYFTTLGEEALLKTEYKYFAKLAREIEGAINLGVYRIKEDDIPTVSK